MIRLPTPRLAVFYCMFAPCALSAAAEPGADQEARLQILMAAFASVSEAAATFREQKTLAILEEPITLEGELHYRAPDYLKKQVLEPRRESFEVDGDRVIIDLGQGKPREVQLDDHPLLRTLITGLRATFAGDLALLKRFYDVRMDGGLEEWVLHLVPHDVAMANTIYAINISGSKNRISAIETLEANGDKTWMGLVPLE